MPAYGWIEVRCQFCRELLKDIFCIRSSSVKSLENIIDRYGEWLDKQDMDFCCVEPVNEINYSLARIPENLNPEEYSEYEYALKVFEKKGVEYTMEPDLYEEEEFPFE